MIQDVQAYVDAVNAADEAYQMAADTRQAAVEAAWTELGESGNPLVAFSVQNAAEYQRETIAILSALPENPTAQDVRDAGRATGFDTAILTQAIRHAVEAGVLSEDASEYDTTEAPRPAGGARRRFLDRVRSQFGASAATEVAQTLDEIVAEESSAR